MKIDRGRVFWGVVLLLVGGFLLAYNLDLFGELTETQWAILLSGISVVLLVGYLVSGLANWGLLFPAAATAAGAAALWLTESGVDELYIGPVVMGIISIPFWLGVIVTRGRDRWALIPAWVLVAVGFAVLLEDRVSDELFASIILWIIALPFLVVFLLNRKALWALIPFFILALVGTVVYFSSAWRDEYIGALIMFGIAVPFYGLALARPQYRWALIPAWVLTAVGGIVLLSILVPGEYVGVFVMLAIGLPFLVVFLLNRQNWWALIPAGVMLTIAIVILLSTWTSLEEAGASRLIGGALFAGLTLVFTALWLTRREDTRWAVYPAVGLAAATVLTVIFGPAVEYLWPAILIVLGFWLLIRGGRLQPKG